MPREITWTRIEQTMVFALLSLEPQCYHMLMQVQSSKHTWEVGNSREWSVQQRQCLHARFALGAVLQQVLWDHESYLSNLRNFYIQKFLRMIIIYSGSISSLFTHLSLSCFFYLFFIFFIFEKSNIFLT